MIAKGNTHKSGSKLAWYLTTAKEGERAELWQLAGFAAGGIRDAFRSVHVMAEATQCEAPFFHVQVRNPDGEELSREEWNRVANRIETKLGLYGQPRAIAFHTDEKTGHEHMHAVWSRIDEETMKARPMPFFKQRLKEVSRQLEDELGLTRVKNERDGPVLAARRNEFEQGRRLGVDVNEVRNAIRFCWDQSDCGRSFQAALTYRELTLAKGDRRDYVVVDREGGIHALGKRILGVSAADTRARLADLNRDQLPTLEHAREQLPGRRDRGGIWDRDQAARAWQEAVVKGAIESAKEKEKVEKENARIERQAAARDRDTPAPTGFRGDGDQLWRAYNTSHDAHAFEKSLGERGLHLARVTEDDVRNSRTFNYVAKLQDKYAPVLRNGEIVVLNEKSHLYRITEHTTGDDRQHIKEFLKPLEQTPLESVLATRKMLEERRINSIDPTPFRVIPDYGFSERAHQPIREALGLLDTAGSGTFDAARSARKVFGLGIGTVEAIFAPRLTPEEKRQAEHKNEVRAAENETKVDLARQMAELAEQRRRHEQEQTVAKDRGDRDR